MKILIVIPHYYKYDPKSKNASSYMKDEARAKVLQETITSIFDTFNPNDRYINNALVENQLIYYLESANTRLKYKIDICICTYKDFHLLDMIDIPKYKYHRIDVNTSSPIYLEFGCLKVLKNNLNHYDYNCLLEDDLVINDSYFFNKLSWFEDTFGIDCLLQPHRYIINQYPRFTKVYCDPELQKSLMRRWVNFNSKLNLEAIYLNKKIKFIKSTNPHSGSFFLSSRQFEHMVNEKSYGIPTAEFISPIESAATLGIMKSFNVYKTVQEDNNFFEIEHRGYDAWKFQDNSNIVTYING